MNWIESDVNFKKVYIVKISGFIPEHKYHEFEQSVHELNRLIKLECLEFGFSKDIFDKDHYYLSINWNNEFAYKKFLNSYEYHLICGSFQALGSIREITYGKLQEVSDK